MPLEDYHRLIALGSTSSNLLIQSIFTDSSYFYPFPKAKFSSDCSQLTEEDRRYSRKNGGIWIDIFPLIPFPELESARTKAWLIKRMNITRVLALKALPWKNCPLWKKTLKPFAALFPRRALNSRFRHLDSSFSDCTERFYLQDFWSATDRIVFPQSFFADTVFLSFEGRAFPCPREYDAFLREYYGDYMTPPPIDKRGGHFSQ